MNYRIGDIIKPVPDSHGVRIQVLSTPVNELCKARHIKGRHKGYVSYSYCLYSTELVRRDNIKPYENIMKHEF